MKEIGKLILSALFPAGCHVCSSPLMKGEKFICTRCYHEFPRTGFQHHTSNDLTSRLGIDTPIERGASLFFYSRDSKLAEVVMDFKYRHFPDLAAELGRRMGAELLPSGFFHDIEAILPMPVHWVKGLKRGYNQVERLAAGLSLATGIPTDHSLRASRGHSTQTAKSPEQRRRNVRGVFELLDPERFAHRRLLLLDDICTTGATLSEAARCIHSAAPTARISVLTLAFAQ